MDRLHRSTLLGAIVRRGPAKISTSISPASSDLSGVVGARTGGAPFVASQEFFGIDHDDRALNLDGGPSTAMYVRLARGRSLIVSKEGPLRTIVTLAPRRSRHL